MAETGSAQKLSLKVKLGFGICDLGGNLFFTIMGFFLLKFLVDFALLDAALAGTALMIGKLWDAVTDPAVGYLSDRTRLIVGRRRPYILIGSVALFGSMIFMFTNPGISDQVMLFVWATVAYCLVNTAYTLVNIPYGALTPELTSDFHERTVLNGYRMVSAAFGTLIGAGATLGIVGIFVNKNLGWSMMGLIMGAVMMVTALITFFTVKESPEKWTRSKEHTSIFKEYGSVLKMKEFLLALIPWTLHITGVTVIQGSLLFYFQAIYGYEENAGVFEIALLILIVSAIILIPIWVKISKRIGKKASYNIGMAIFAAAVVIFFLFGELLGLYFAYAIMFIAGIGFATQYVMPYAIVPDVVEFDYANTGLRREGVFYGMWTFMSKVGQGIAFFVSGLILGAVKYNNATPLVQTDLAQAGIKLLVGPIPALFFIWGIIILTFYPITRQFYEQILEKIRRRDDATATATATATSSTDGPEAKELRSGARDRDREAIREPEPESPAEPEADYEDDPDGHDAED